MITIIRTLQTVITSSPAWFGGWRAPMSGQVANAFNLAGGLSAPDSGRVDL